jgi:hypothetical protein
MPSANSRISVIAKSSSNDMNTEGPAKEIAYPDFIICSRILYLCRTTNQLLNENNNRKVYADLECALL